MQALPRPSNTNANAAEQGNTLPILPGNLARNVATGTSPHARRNDQARQSSFGYLLMADAAVDHDASSSNSLVSRAPDTPNTMTGQMRPLASHFRASTTTTTTTLPLRSNYSPSEPWARQRLDYHDHSHRRTSSAGSGSDISLSDISVEPSSPSDMASPQASAPKPVSDQKTTPNVTRKDDEGDCSICWEPFEKEKNELIWCKLTCGNNFHKKCFVEWLLTPKHQRTTGELTCPFCRGKWDPAELRTLQIDNGITPARPIKRPRVDTRVPYRSEMRRLYRERNAQRGARAPYDQHPPRWMGDSYRPAYASRPNAVPGGSENWPPASANTSPYYSPPSMRPVSGAPPATSQASSSAFRPLTHPIYPSMQPMQHFSPAMPYDQSMNVAYTSPYGSTFHAPFPHQAQTLPSPPMSPPNQPHEPFAPGYNPLAFTQTPYLPPLNMMQQPRSPPGPPQPRMSRCPAMQSQAQPQRMSPTSPHAAASQFGTTSMSHPHFCPGMPGMMPVSFDMQVNYSYSASYNLAGPSMP